MNGEQNASKDKPEPVYEMQLAAGGVESGNPEEQKEPASESYAKSIYKLLPEPFRKLSIAEQVNIGFTASLAFFTLIVGIFTCALWYETHRLADGENMSAKETRERVELDERPWLTSSQASSDRALDDTADAVFTVQIINTGRTPATYRARVEVFYSTESPISAETLSFMESYVKIRPEDSVGVATTSARYELHPTATGADRVAFRAKQTPAGYSGPIYTYLVGRIEYVDVFGHHHTTNFCYYMKDAGDPSHLFQISSNGNRFD